MKLINSEYLNTIKNDEKTKIIDVRTYEKFSQGHIDNAISFPAIGIEDKMNPIPGEIVNDIIFKEIVESKGINNQDLIVIYGENIMPQMATRILWTFEYFGHNNSVILDGMIEDWTKKYPLVTQSTCITPTNYTLGEPKLNIKVDSKYLLDNLFNCFFIDARPEDQFTGKIKVDENLRSGFIPNAVNIPFTLFIDKNGYFKNKEEIELIVFDRLNNINNKEKVIYCQRGHRSSLVWFVLKYILEIETMVYDGSMVEWSNDNRFPIETI